MGEKYTKPVYDRPEERMKRKCLCCKKEFMSDWIGNRICPKCKDTANYKESKCSI